MNNKSKLIYIAGPYRAENEDSVWENIMAMRDIAKRLWQFGYIPIVPHLNSMLMGGIVEDDRFIKGDLEILKAIFASGGSVVFCGDWENSEGCNLEVVEAQKIGMKIYWSIGELLEDK